MAGPLCWHAALTPPDRADLLPPVRADGLRVVPLWVRGSGGFGGRLHDRFQQRASVPNIAKPQVKGGELLEPGGATILTTIHCYHPEKVPVRTSDSESWSL